MEMLEERVRKLEQSVAQMNARALATESLCLSMILLIDDEGRNFVREMLQIQLSAAMRSSDRIAANAYSSLLGAMDGALSPD